MSCHSSRKGCIQILVRTRITYLNGIKIKLDRAEAFFKDIELVCGRNVFTWPDSDDEPSRQSQNPTDRYLFSQRYQFQNLRNYLHLPLRFLPKPLLITHLVPRRR